MNEGEAAQLDLIQQLTEQSYHESGQQASLMHVCRVVSANPRVRVIQGETAKLDKALNLGGEAIKAVEFCGMVITVIKAGALCLRPMLGCSTYKAACGSGCWELLSSHALAVHWVRTWLDCCANQPHLPEVCHTCMHSSEQRD